MNQFKNKLIQQIYFFILRNFAINYSKNHLFEMIYLRINPNNQRFTVNISTYHFSILRTTVKLHFQTQYIDSSQLTIIELRIFSIGNLDSCSISKRGGWKHGSRACVCVSSIGWRRRIEKDERFNKGLEIDGHPWAMMAIYDASCIIIIFHDTRRVIEDIREIRR